MNTLQTQLMLRSVGYTPGTTGKLDDQTQRSLKAFQRDVKLPATGMMDADTKQLLKRCYVNIRQVG